MNTTTTTPKIYVACLASYNAGILHGRWIDADQDADDTCVCSMYFVPCALGFGIAYAIAGRPYAYFGSLVGATCVVGIPFCLLFLASRRIEHLAVLGALVGVVLAGWLGTYWQASRLKSD